LYLNRIFNIINISIYKHYKKSIFKAVLGTSLFVIIYFSYNIEFIRGKFEDFAFDSINRLYLSSLQQRTPSPKVMLFTIDYKYLNSNNLLNEHNETNYGYIFPRDQIASFLNRVDKHLKIINKYAPKAIFIDYDMSYTSNTYNLQLTKEDKCFLEILKKEHKYKILLPKTSTYNFVEQSTDPKIKSLIAKDKISFVSVGLKMSSDNINRRYSPYKIFNNKVYFSAPINLWAIVNDKNLSINNYKKNDIINNRIIYKQYKDIGSTSIYDVKQSYWTNLTKYSANYPLNQIINENFENSLIILGTSYSENGDIFANNSLLGVDNLSGVDIQANALMTLFNLNGPLQQINIWIGLVFVFIIIFVIDIFVQIMFEMLNYQNNKRLEFLISLIISVLIMSFLSIHILLHYNLWFNWVAPLIIFEIFELLDAFKIFSLWKWIKNIIEIGLVK
jgi:CHASE2 domain-containing sensor protein